MEVLDTTLREGEQCYGVFFSLSTKVQLARLVDQAGVAFIEVGHPAAAPSIRQAAAEISRLDLRAQRIGHARMDRDEIRLVRDLGLQWVGLFCGINTLGLARHGMTRQAMLERIRGTVLFAKEMGLSVRFTCEDASRTDPGELAELYGHLKELRVDRISYADTVGTDTPEKLEHLSRRFAGTVPFDALHFHFHNDQGKAIANAVKAAELGAQCIDVSVLGVGERMGLVPLEVMLGWQAQKGLHGAVNSRERDHAMRSARMLVLASLDRRRYRNRRFAHKSGIHIHGVSRDPRQYEHADPAEYGCRRLIVLSKLIGRTGLRMLLEQSGFEEDDEGIGRLLMAVKSEDRLELADPAEIVRYLEGCHARRRQVAVDA